MSPQNPYGTGRRCIYQCQPYYNFKIEQQSALGIIVDEVKEVVTLGTNEIDKGVAI